MKMQRFPAWKLMAALLWDGSLGFIFILTGAEMFPVQGQ